MLYRITHWIVPWGTLLVLLCFALPNAPARAALGAPFDLALALEFRPVASGVVYATFQGELFGRGQRVHVVVAARNHPTLVLQPTLAAGQVRGVEALPAQADRLRTPEQRVVAAVNGDFYYTGPVAGVPFGLHISNEELIAGPNGSPVIAGLRDGHLVIDQPNLSAAVHRLTADGRHLSSAQLTDVNRFVVRDTMVLYTPAFGRSTPALASGIWLVLEEVGQPIGAGGTYTAKVASVRPADGASVVIPPGGAVLGALGSAELFFEAVAPGDRFEIAIRLTPPFDEAVWALAGPNHIVKDGERAWLDPRDAFVTTRHPRTAVGFNEDAIFLVVVEGRRFPEAAGMSLPELAELLLALGATEAINLDGGGSTTLLARRPGEEQASLANRPSDGRVRPVANGLALLSRAPMGELAVVQLVPPADLIWIGSRFHVDVVGLDADFGPASVPADLLEWRAWGDAVRSEGGGTFVAQRVGEARIVAQVGDVAGAKQVWVTDEVPSLGIVPSSIGIAIHQQLPLALEAWREGGEPVWVGPERVRWWVEGEAASVSPNGVLWGERIGTARVHAALRDQWASAGVSVTPAPTTVWAFDRLGPWGPLAVRANAALSLSAEQALFGQTSARLEYDLTPGPSGTAAAYLQADPPILIAGDPSHVGAWIYGDGSGHWLRGQYIDAHGNPHVIDFTPPQGLTWTGWNYVEAALDPAAPRPLALQRIYIAETDDAYKGQGRLFIDRIVAIYTGAGDH